MPQVLKHTPGYQHLHFYQKSDAIYQLTYIFCQRFLPKYGDRTVDQMLQAARSGKQNIVEGIEDGVASSEMKSSYSMLLALLCKNYEKTTKTFSIHANSSIGQPNMNAIPLC